MDGKWKTHDSKAVYENEYATVSVVDVEKPDGERLDHHVVSCPHAKGGVSVLAHDPEKGILLIWRHRFITDTWAWELPGGGINQNESPEAAAAREMQEETGWVPGKLTELVTLQPMPGLIDFRGYLFASHGATWQGPSRDKNEAADIAWLSVEEVRSLMQKGDVSDGFTVAALLWAMQFGPLHFHSH